MPFCTLNEGHYRALEKSLSGLFASIGDGTPTALVTAGEVQAGRIRSVLLASRNGPLAGVDLLPGILQLAAKLSDTPCIRTRTSPADRAAIALRAMSSLGKGEPFSEMRGNVSSASSLGTFFEKLLEQGITPEMYSVCSGMLQADPGPVEIATGRLFDLYTGLRNSHYPFTPDQILSNSPGDTCRYGVIVFYGFYDLNPGQRRFVRRLADTGADIHWFSPVHPSSRWRDVYGRTGNFLRELGFRKRSRVDWDTELSPSADIAEALLGGYRIRPDPGIFGITAAPGEMGAAREVLARVTGLQAGGVPLREIAVITRKPDDSLVTRLAHHEGVPISAPLTSPLLELPLASLTIAITQLPEEDFHYTSFEALISTGMLRPAIDPGVTGLREAISQSGVRNGLDNWRSALREDAPLRQLIDMIGDFYDSRSGKEKPSSSLDSLRNLVVELSGCAGDDPLIDRIFPVSEWCLQEPVDWWTFSALLRQHLAETRIDLRTGDAEGFRILSFERTRGSLWSALIVLDLEEGIFPSRQIDDPRLSAELRSALQLPDPLIREREEAFLLYQAMEASNGCLTLVYRYLDSQSRPMRPSPFIAGALSPDDREGRPEFFTRRPSSPFGILLGGDRPGQVSARSALKGRPETGRFFLGRAITAERSRISRGPFGEYDGILGSGFHSREVWSASSLAGYVSCPFAYMAESVWKLDREEEAGASFEPDALSRGLLVHACLERVFNASGVESTDDEVRSELNAAAGDLRLRKRLGSQALMKSYLDNLSVTIISAIRALRETG